LRADTFYSAGNVRDVADATDPLQIEAVLRRGYEVVWDFTGANPQDPGGVDDNGVWQACASCSLMAHAMLIVGYDKRDPDSDNHYFIVKNSWGTAFTSDSEGFTYISYDYLRNYGVAASYVTTVEAPGPWPEIAFIGRWQLNFSGHRGELDIYHLPGMARETFEYNYGVDVIDSIPVDRRIGAFYDTQGNAYKVNGIVSGNRIEFYFDGPRPALPWDELSGRRFVYYLDGNDFMAGIHTDTNGTTWGGYARKAGYLPSHGVANAIRPIDENSYVGTSWNLYTELETGTVTFSRGTYFQGDGYYLYEGAYTAAGSTTTTAVQMRVNTSDLGRVSMQILSYGPSGGAESFIGELFSHEAGFIAGHTTEIAPVYPFSMELISAP